MIDAFTERFEHPYLFALVPAAGVLLGLAVGADVTGADFAAGFLTLYAMVALIVCTVGYLGIYSLAYSTEVLRQWRIRRSGFE